jgi:hypothetical protein
MDIVNIDKCRYEVQEQKEVPIWYAGMYRPIWSTACTVQRHYRLTIPLRQTTAQSSHLKNSNGICFVESALNIA